MKIFSDEIERLAAELNAIGWWDLDHRRKVRHEEYEKLAFVARQKRRMEIVSRLLRIERALKNEQKTTGLEIKE
jgi:hypothetical protein